jgi:FemAB-related protein (PEP-CTERM system-associated)
MFQLNIQEIMVGTDEKAWDEYVLKSNYSSFYHQIGWKRVVEKTYGYKPIYLLVKEGNEIRGVLPMFLIKSGFFGKKLVSVPFGPYGGVCSDNTIATEMLIKEAKRIVDKENLDYLELRNFVKCNNNGFITNESYVTFIVNLCPDPQIVWEKIKRDKRRKVEKTKNAGLEIDWNATVEDFYKVHARTMRDLGTPTHGLDFFKNCLNEFPNNAKVLTTKYRDKPICCQFLFFYKETEIAVWGSSLDEYKDYHSDQLSNWEVIKYGCEKGFRYFDFGRCLHDTGVYRYKERWSGYPKQLYYQYYLNNVSKMPDTSQVNPNREKFSKVWKRLPVQITNKLGPVLRRKIP